jgi:hypothetical protein
MSLQCLLAAFASFLTATAGLSQGPSPAASQMVNRGLPGFRLAVKADFVQELAAVETATAIQTDFNHDGRDDWAVVAINESSREYRIYYVLNLPQGPRFDLLLSTTFPEASASGAIRNAIFVKAPGTPGIAHRKYARILGDAIDLEDPKNNTPAIRRDVADRTQEYTSVTALEIWTGPARVDAKDLRNFPDQGVAYCSTAWYYDRNGALAHFSACD